MIEQAEVQQEQLDIPNLYWSVADVAPRRESADAFNRMEKLRDPSHVRALTSDELEHLISDTGFEILGTGSFRLAMELGKPLRASFPRPADADRIRKMFREELETDSMGIRAHVVDGEIRYSYPVTVIAARK